VERKKVTVLDIRQKADADQRITMLTAYDYPSALLVDQAGIDIILVGDSLNMVVLGRENTVTVTMEEMLHHCRAVSRAAKTALLVGDMPFMSYQLGSLEAARNAGRFLKEADMDVVKLEGGRQVAPVVEAIVGAGIPVMGHIGLTPQYISQLGGFRVQGKTAEAAQALLDDALALEAAGCFALVLEAIPSPVARRITQTLQIPTIGIGAGPDCDGQVLVFHDLIGLFDRFVPKFVKQYARVTDVVAEALAEYKEDVENGRFPAAEHEYAIQAEELERLY
jgi:3-methyl-2-oxobutanoate hydroxymethyltransferase